MSLSADRMREVIERKLLAVSTDDAVHEVLYVLSLEGGHYYVGKTKNMQRRFAEHMEGGGAQVDRAVEAAAGGGAGRPPIRCGGGSSRRTT